MTNEEHYNVIQKGSAIWNAWRLANPAIRPSLNSLNLNGANLNGADLSDVDFSHASLNGADLSQTNLSGAMLIEAELRIANLRNARIKDADLTRADLRAADLFGVDLRWSNLSSADLSGASVINADLYGAVLNSADLERTDFRAADLGNVDFRGASLRDTNFTSVNLTAAVFEQALLGNTTFANVDLSEVKALHAVKHSGPSSIGLDTLIRSGGKLPVEFLIGVGVPENIITQIPSLIRSIQPIQFYSCFISYNHKDEQFCQHLYSRMRSENLRVWYAPEDMKGGRKLHEEVFRAIQIHDKLLLVLSDNSMESEWVRTELRRAQKVEREEHRRKLFPIRLVDIEAIQNWECFDADSRKDLAMELREYYIPDFSNWRDNASFESEFAKLLRDLRATEL